MLKAEGYLVHLASDAEQALQLVQTHPPDLILTDLQLPGMDGLEFTRRIKSDPVTRDIWVIALTAYSLLEDEKQAQAAGCDDYLTKPVSIHHLSERLTHYLSQN